MARVKNPSVAPRDVPGRSFRSRKFHPEHIFDLAEFEGRPDCSWAVSELRRRRLDRLCTPPTAVAHERLVRVFYERMTYSCTMPDTLETVVGVTTITITPRRIAQMLGIPHFQPPDMVDQDGQPLYRPEFPANMTLFSVVMDMCDGVFTTPSQNCTSKSMCPSDLWFLDTVLTKNAHPLQHVAERRGDFLYCLYAFHTGTWFSVPSLIWGQMYKVWDGLVKKQMTRASSWRLPFPFLVAAFLEDASIPVSDTDIQLAPPSRFTHTHWVRVRRHLARQDHQADQLEDVDMDAPMELDGEPAAPAEGEPVEEEEDDDEDDATGLGHQQFEILATGYSCLAADVERLQQGFDEHVQETQSQLAAMRTDITALAQGQRAIIDEFRAFRNDLQSLFIGRASASTSTSAPSTSAPPTEPPPPPPALE